MATVYISYASPDKDLAVSLASTLKEKGHTVLFDQGLQIGMAWRDKLQADLLASDVVLVLWTEATFRSQFVAAEVGAVRATPHIGLLPVLIGEIAIPPVLQDLHVERLPTRDPAELRSLAEKLESSIRYHIEHRARHRKGMPKVFISHRHKDEQLVQALVDCLKVRFVIDSSDLRCTSVAPYRLPVGANTAERLRQEVREAEVVLGVLTTDTLQSTYVAFELGSAWGQNVWTCPLLARGANEGHVPDPIRGLSPLFLSKTRDCTQLVQDLERATSLVHRSDFSYAELDDKVGRLVAAAQEPISKG